MLGSGAIRNRKAMLCTKHRAKNKAKSPVISDISVVYRTSQAESGCRRTDLLVEPMERAASLRTRVDLRHAVSEPEIAEASQL